MQRLSMMKFKRMCEAASPLEFSFSICNQAQKLRSIELTSTYQEMLMMFNPNRICLKGKTGTICFNRVKEVDYYDESQAFGMVFGIVCGNGLSEDGETVYKIIADKNFNM